MSGTTHRNPAARMGRWSAAHWKTATFGWLAFVVLAVLLGSAVGTRSVDASRTGPGESGRMDRILAAGFAQPAGENVLIQSDQIQVGQAAFRTAVEDVVARVSSVPAVQNVSSPLDPRNPGQVAADGSAALVTFQIRGDRNQAASKIEPVLRQVADAQRAHPGFFIGEFGDASAEQETGTAYEADLARAGLLSIPITLAILVLTFGTLVAAGIPLLLALSAVFATFGLIAVPSHILPEAQQAPALVLLIGLAVGVDYSMFYLKPVRSGPLVAASGPRSRWPPRPRAARYSSPA
jgi:uncharacterized membrane protein YdfJ with MMPL/SSD domain